VFSTAALAKELDLVNIGAAGTFVSRRPITVASIARELPHGNDLVMRPAAEVTRLVEAGPPKVPAGAVIFVSVPLRRATKAPPLPIERPAGHGWALRIVEKRGAFVICARRPDRQRGLDLSAILAREFGVPFTTRSWGTMERIAAAISALRAPARPARP